MRLCPICSRRCRIPSAASETSSTSSGTIAISHTHQGNPHSFQPCWALTAASSVCIAMITPTAGAASQRDSNSSSRALSGSAGIPREYYQTGRPTAAAET